MDRPAPARSAGPRDAVSEIATTTVDPASPEAPVAPRAPMAPAEPLTPASPAGPACPVAPLAPFEPLPHAPSAAIPSTPTVHVAANHRPCIGGSSTAGGQQALRSRAGETSPNVPSRTIDWGRIVPQAQTTRRPSLSERARELYDAALEASIRAPRNWALSVAPRRLRGLHPVPRPPHVDRARRSPRCSAEPALGVPGSRTTYLAGLLADRIFAEIELGAPSCEAGHGWRSDAVRGLRAGRELLTEWLVGTVFVGAILATALGLGAYACAPSGRKRRAGAQARAKTRESARARRRTRRRTRLMDLVHRLRNPRRQHLRRRRRDEDVVLDAHADAAPLGGHRGVVRARCRSPARRSAPSPARAAAACRSTK